MPLSSLLSPTFDPIKGSNRAAKLVVSKAICMPSTCKTHVTLWRRSAYIGTSLLCRACVALVVAERMTFLAEEELVALLTVISSFMFFDELLDHLNTRTYTTN